MMRLSLFPLLLLLGVSAAAEERADWTLLVYSVADNDLEWYNVQEAREFAEATPSDRVNVAFLLDRHDSDDEDAGYTAEPLGPLGDFTGARRFAIRGGRFVDVEDLGEPNMGDTQVFVDFLEWGVATCPAKRYAVIMADHGMGYLGFGGDESHEGDCFTLDEIGTALDEGCKAAGIERIDLLFWDCCSMGEVEVAVECAPYARVMLASEATMPGEGTDPGTWLTALAENPRMDAAELGAAVCDAYREYFQDHPTQRVITLATIDLDQIFDVVAACDALARRLVGELSEGGEEAWTSIAEAGEAAETVEFTDLKSLGENLEACGGGEESKALLAAIEEAVTSIYAGEDYEGTCGLSVYFPSSPDWVDEAYPEGCLSETWDNLNAAGMAVAEGDEVPPEIAECAATDPDLAEGEASHVTATIDPKGVADCYFVLAAEKEGKRVVLGRYPVDPSHGRLDEEFDGTWLSLGDAQNQVLASIARYDEINSGEEVYVVEVPVEYQGAHGGTWHALTLSYEVDWNDDEFKAVFLSAMKEGRHGRAPFRIRPGGKVRPVYLEDDGEGRERRVTLADARELVVGGSGLDLLEDDLPPGRYVVGFVAWDVAGNAAEAMIPVEVR